MWDLMGKRGCDKSTLRCTLSVLTKGRLPFRKAIPETVISVFVLAFMSDLPEAHAA